jgi:hypothetical protein
MTAGRIKNANPAQACAHRQRAEKTVRSCLTTKGEKQSRDSFALCAWAWLECVTRTLFLGVLLRVLFALRMPLDSFAKSLSETVV